MLLLPVPVVHASDKLQTLKHSAATLANGSKLDNETDSANDEDGWYHAAACLLLVQYSLAPFFHTYTRTSLVVISSVYSTW